MSVNFSVVRHCLMVSSTVVASCRCVVIREQQDVQSFADSNLQHELYCGIDALINALTRD